jgi:hypothetical protein
MSAWLVLHVDPNVHGCDVDRRGDDELPACVAIRQMPDGLSGVAQWICLLDDRRDLAGLDELLENEQVRGVLARDERAQLLTHER